MSLEIQKYILGMWRIFSQKLLCGFAIVLFCCSFAFVFGQFPMGDTTKLSKLDSIRLNDSIRKYTLSKIDTSYTNFSPLLHRKSFADDLRLAKMQIQSPQINNKFSWLMVIVLLCIVIVTLVKLFYKNYYNVLFNNLTSLHVFNAKRDLGNLNNLGSFLLNIVYLLTSSISIYFIVIFFYPSIPDKVSLYFLILLIFTIHYLLKLLILYFIEKIIKNSYTIEYYRKSISVTNQFMSLCILLIVIIYLTGAKSQDAFIVYLLLSILTIGQLVKFIKGLLSNMSQISAYFFHFILYICTLEIAPIIILYKLFITYV